VTMKVPEHLRIRSGRLKSDASFGCNGAFTVKVNTEKFMVIASDGMGWEHVSVSPLTARRCPTWKEMCAIKAMFWDAEDWVVQFHPAASEYVNCHPHCLHLWRPTEGNGLPMPPSMLVGPKAEEVQP